MKRPRGRPPKPEGELHVMKAFRFPPGLWDEVERYIPKGERTDIIHRCLRREVDRRKRAGPAAPSSAKEPESGESGDAS